MTDQPYDHIRLEKGGTVVAYLDSVTAIGIPSRNDVKTKKRPGTDFSPITRDQGLTEQAIRIRGKFLHSDHITDSAHKTALETLFGSLPVTERQQANRVRHYLHKVGGPFEFYDGPDEYTQTDPALVDYEAGVFEVVQIQGFALGSRVFGVNQRWSLELVVGVVS